MDKRQDLFAATPPIEAVKMLLSMAVTEGIGYQRNKWKSGKKLDFIDVRRAYFHAKARRTVFIELPEEDQERGMCGELDKSMYGTRDAALNWEWEYTEFMTKQGGFKKGRASPCIFKNEEKGMCAVIHGDDFTILGSEEDLDWLKEKSIRRFEIKHRGRLGPGDSDDK